LSLFAPTTHPPFKRASIRVQLTGVSPVWTWKVAPDTNKCAIRKNECSHPELKQKN
jgi:hypothetical protein